MSPPEPKLSLGQLEAFEPSGERARVLYDRMKRDLGRSIAEIARVCRGRVGFDEGAVERLCEKLSEATVIRPAFYASYFDLLDAARRDALVSCGALLAELTQAEVEAPAFRYRRWGDVEPALAELYLRYLNIDPETPVDLAALDCEQFGKVCTVADRALATFDAAAPEISGEIRGLIKEIVMVESAPDAAMNFDGATSVFTWGALFLNATEHQNIVDMADGLSHESAHAHLFGISLGEAFVENSPEECFASPLRAEPRPMDGIFHATYVSARMHYAHSRLLKSSVLSKGEREQACDACMSSIRAFKDGIETVDAHARLTDAGRRVLESARRYMAVAA